MTVNLIFITLFILSMSTAFAANKPPPHTIADESRLMNGMRIQINTKDKNLTVDTDRNLTLKA